MPTLRSTPNSGIHEQSLLHSSTVSDNPVLRKRERVAILNMVDSDLLAQVQRSMQFPYRALYKCSETLVVIARFDCAESRSRSLKIASHTSQCDHLDNLVLFNAILAALAAKAGPFHAATDKS